jgi:chaperone required for assembly of F1-ATPase
VTDGPSQIDPIRLAQQKMRRELPKRFYKEAGYAPGEAGFTVQLDGKAARTPNRAVLTVPGERLAAALAAEWNAPQDVIAPTAMPLTRIVNAAIDGVAANMAAVRADIVAYAGSDLLCYRAGSPAALVQRQEAAWTPLINWAAKELGARFIVVEGIAHVAQAPQSLAAIERALAGYDAFRLAAIHTITTITGSAIIALAVARARLSAAEAWTAAGIDEDWQAEQWGEDPAARARRNERCRELEAAAFILESAG